jgi:hypothetical protein
MRDIGLRGKDRQKLVLVSCFLSEYHIQQGTWFDPKRGAFSFKEAVCLDEMNVEF